MPDDTTTKPIDSGNIAPAENRLLYYIALGLVPGIGGTLAKRLIAKCGSAEAVFREKKALLQKVSGIGATIAHKITGQQVLQRAEKECAFLLKNNFHGLCYIDDKYPQRLAQCEDGPVVLFVNGTVDFNQTKILSIVGTRQATPYGLERCEAIVAQLAARGHAPVIVSGLAYGIDICAHKAALNNHLPTVAVMATGLDKIYPSLHHATAKQITAQEGALVTDFLSDTKPDRQNFVQRNRIIAGLADATLVVESGEKGGALITAGLALSYNRDVLAVPGRAGDPCSKGCNALIRSNRAALVENIADIEYALGWDPQEKEKAQQLSLFAPLSGEGKMIVETLKANPAATIDAICYATKIPMSRLSALLFKMEIDNLLRTLPGKRYELK
ncbi:MAG: DNA-processing protein DprA [Prevotellaceae bacterium]|jgi:DNA processing protein|nr:DNA-processing protein DprA [Prevotellaceae bacterium]